MDERIDISNINFVTREPKKILIEKFDPERPEIEKSLVNKIYFGDPLSFNYLANQNRFQKYICLYGDPSRAISNKVFDFFDFSGLLLKNFFFVDCSFINTNFRFSKLENLKFNNCNMGGIKCEFARFRSCTIDDCKLDWANFRSGFMAKIKISRTFMRSPKFIDNDLSFAEIKDSEILNPDLSECKCIQTNFSGSTIIYPKLNQATIKDAVFDRSRLILTLTEEAGYFSLTARSAVDILIQPFIYKNLFEENYNDYSNERSKGKAN